jgi:predicted DNA-binding protein (MmcQ/YjbR family)
MGKMFALCDVDNFTSLNLKCLPDRAIELRESYHGIIHGYHMSKIHWNTVYFHRDVTDVLLLQMIHASYALVYQSLSHKIKNSINAE